MDKLTYRAYHLISGNVSTGVIEKHSVHNSIIIYGRNEALELINQWNNTGTKTADGPNKPHWLYILD